MHTHMHAYACVHTHTYELAGGWAGGRADRWMCHRYEEQLDKADTKKKTKPAAKPAGKR